MYSSQALGLIHGKLLPLTFISAMGMFKLVRCFFTTRWTSLSLFSFLIWAHRAMPDFVAATSPISEVTALAVEIWELHEASAKPKWIVWIGGCKRYGDNRLYGESNAWVRPRKWFTCIALSDRLFYFPSPRKCHHIACATMHLEMHGRLRLWHVY